MISYDDALKKMKERERPMNCRIIAAQCVRSRTLCTLIVLVLAALLPTTQLNARELTDIFGGKVVVPDHIRKAYATSPPATYMLYAIDPAVLAGLNTPVRKWEKRYLRKQIQRLPVLGGWYGQGYVPNIEMVLKVNPQIIIVPSLHSAIDERTNHTLKDVPIPAVSVKMDTLASYPDAFTTLGEALGRQRRAKKLSVYARKTAAQIARIVDTLPSDRRVSVYYAEGEDGLSTECGASMHVELIELAGGLNVHRCASKTGYGMEKVSLEQVLLYNPDVILVFERLFFKSILSDPRWRQIKAVREGKVYLIPRQPFNWFDRPPSFMRVLGLKWLTNLLHPELYPVDIVKETQSFYTLFLDVNLTRKEASAILYYRTPD
ncbi:MAG: ABC transporter substrate-binding protein [Syntrophorhabdaceae bacterium]|nr:ABC transporter substrate-binding protein [Syntrophorhabdaceae bacterium]